MPDGVLYRWTRADLTEEVVVGRRIRCLSARLQLQLHEDYERNLGRGGVGGAEASAIDQSYGRRTDGRCRMTISRRRRRWLLTSAA